MQILSIGNFTGRGWDGSITDENHIADALESLGHEVIRVQREEVGQLLVPREPVDFTLIAQWDGYPSLVMLPRPLIYWAFDYQDQNQDWHNQLIIDSDLYLSKRIADSKYPNWQWLSQDFAPWFMGRHNEKPERDIDVLFTGSFLPWAEERNTTIAAIAQSNKYNFELHSVNDWAGFDVKPPVMDKDYTALVARAKINISIDHTLETGYWSDRSAQIMACGGFVLMRYTPMAETTFGQYVAWFYSPEDCLEKIDYYLANEDKRKMIATMGYTHAQTHLMAKNRVQDLLTIVESISC